MAIYPVSPSPSPTSPHSDQEVFATISAVTMYTNMQPFSMAGFVEEL